MIQTFWSFFFISTEIIYFFCYLIVIKQFDNMIDLRPVLCGYNDCTSIPHPLRWLTRDWCTGNTIKTSVITTNSYYIGRYIDIGVQTSNIEVVTSIYRIGSRFRYRCWHRELNIDIISIYRLSIPALLVTRGVVTPIELVTFPSPYIY